MFCNLLIASVLGKALQLPDLEIRTLRDALNQYVTTAILTIFVGIPIAFFALWCKGYLAPLGFVALTLVFAQVIAATGYGSYFPWSVPGLYSGAGGEYRKLLDYYSYGILFLTGLAGYVATMKYWNLADQNK